VRLSDCVLFVLSFLFFFFSKRFGTDFFFFFPSLSSLLQLHGLLQTSEQDVLLHITKARGATTGDISSVLSRLSADAAEAKTRFARGFLAKHSFVGDIRRAKVLEAGIRGKLQILRNSIASDLQERANQQDGLLARLTATRGTLQNLHMNLMAPYVHMSALGLNLSLQAPQDVNSLPRFLRLWGSEGAGDGELSHPAGVAVHPFTDDVYVCDFFNHRIQIFSAEGVYLSQWGTEGGAPGEFKFPVGIAISPQSGEVFVTDDNHRVQVFDRRGLFLRQWGSLGSGNGDFDCPHGVAISSKTAKVFVCDSKNDRVQMFKPDGTFLGQFAKNKKGRRGRVFLVHPRGITIQNDGAKTENVYVVEKCAPGYKVFDGSGFFCRLEPGTKRFVKPRGLAFSPVSNQLFLIDRKSDLVIHAQSVAGSHDGRGKTLGRFGAKGEGEGEFISPHSVAVSGRTGHVYITDFKSHCVQVFSVKAA
jgi:DNA-binding beta-propeller fold protein YncE